MDWVHIGELALTVAIFAPGLVLIALAVLLWPFTGKPSRSVPAPTALQDHDARRRRQGQESPHVAARAPVQTAGAPLSDA